MKHYVVTGTGAYSLAGGLYIGEPSFAENLSRRYGIEAFFGKRENSTVASIGYSPKDGKWYGFSHRAICGFGIGDKLFEKSFGDGETKFTEHGRKEITTMKQARESARRFAEYVD